MIMPSFNSLNGVPSVANKWLMKKVLRDEWGFDGVVIACIDFRDKEVVELIQSDVPVVTIDHIFNNRIVKFVTGNFY